MISARGNGNRLAGTHSPYLLQHKDNPVDWYPWGDEAFDRAAELDRPIFLSVGYATCHWCHVMERESFEDDDVAALMNEHFVSVKVDREERPDIDAIYMTACQMLTGHGGWPLTIIMTPDRRPFFAATYIPRESRYGRPGMLDLLPRIAGVWHAQREEVFRSAEHLTETLKRAAMLGADPSTLDAAMLDDAFNAFRRHYDATNGGFGSSPKFPSPHNFLFLLRYAYRTGKQDAIDMVTHSLKTMHRGGIFDHVGGGFHRYATDAHWHLPHFEKMLYDQALLALAYTEACQATGSEAFAEVVRRTLDYVLRDLAAEGGGFYSAEDADSEGREGQFYVWTVEEVESVLDEDDARFAVRAFGMREEGNFEDEATRQRTGENVLYRAVRTAELARQFGISVEEVSRKRRAIERQLFEHRAGRPRPLRDEKVLADWNGLAVASLAVAGRVLGEERYTQAAAKAVEFVWSVMRDGEGRLLHRFFEGEAGIPGMMADYAAMTWGLLELHQSTLDPMYLRRALELTRIARELFFDTQNGGFFSALASPELIVRQKDVQDSAIPSANAVQAWNLVRLARLTGDHSHEKHAREVFDFASPLVREYPAGFGGLLIGVEASVSASTEIVVVGSIDGDGTRGLISTGRENYHPHRALLLKDPKGDELDDIAPFVKEHTMVDGRATAYVCRNFACELPTTDPSEMKRQLSGKDVNV